VTGALVNQRLTYELLQEYRPNPRVVKRHILALPQHDLVYVKNPKAGSSTVMVWLDRLHTGEHDGRLQRMHKDHRLPSHREVGRQRVLRMLSGEAYRFSFVRDPVRRLESVYWAKLVRSKRYRIKAATALGLRTQPDQVIPFEEFLDALDQPDLLNMDAHWRPQHRNLFHPLVTFDRIGRLESFEADFARIQEEAGLPEVPLEQVNANPRSDRRSVYDGRPDLRSRVEQLYAKDMELYGY
jgi:hypothetical protein